MLISFGTFLKFVYFKTFILDCLGERYLEVYIFLVCRFVVRKLVLSKVKNRKPGHLKLLDVSMVIEVFHTYKEY